MWTARRILKELTDSGVRKRILTAFWLHAEPSSRLLAAHHLAQALRFRDETIRKMTPGRKAELLASRIGAPEFDEFLEVALMQYHTHEKKELMAALLDRWNIPHENGSIEADDYARPDADQVRDALREVEARFDRGEIVLYLAAAGLLMDDAWRAAAWPVVDEMTAAAPRQG
ncbi:MAG TPA: hypothetical protein VM779_11925 [Thermoanaerobaculia bacterium]|nr:hypothetical protein [Thermoanaerobaculia bacterium]